VGQPESELTGVESSNLIRDARKEGLEKFFIEGQKTKHLSF